MFVVVARARLLLIAADARVCVLLLVALLLAGRARAFERRSAAARLFPLRLPRPIAALLTSLAVSAAARCCCLLTGRVVAARDDENSDGSDAKMASTYQRTALIAGAVLSVLLASLVFSATAHVPHAVVELNADSFAESVKEGTWFVKLYVSRGGCSSRPARTSARYFVLTAPLLPAAPAMLRGAHTVRAARCIAADATGSDSARVERAVIRIMRYSRRSRVQCLGAGQRMAPEWENFAEVAGDYFHIADVDCTKNSGTPAPLSAS